MRFRFVAIAICCWLLAPGIVAADYVEVRRSATVKEEPRRDATILVRPEIGAALNLLSETQTNGYYNVESPDGSGPGWIYRSLVRRHAGEAPRGDGSTDARSGELEVHVIDVGQADAILIRCPDGTHELVIDSGDTRYTGSRRNFRNYIEARQEEDNAIEVVVASHPHADHIGSMAWLIRNYDVELYVDNGNVYDSRTFERVEEAYEERQPGYWSAQDGIVPDIDFCTREDVHARLLVTEEFGGDPDPNNNSVIVRVDYGATSFLFVGDAEEEAEERLLHDPETRVLLDCDFLKAGHHGSHTSSSEDFLNAVSPAIVAVSCGAKGVSTNRGYRHPRAEKIEALLEQADPRQGANVVLEAFDTEDRVWEKITLDRAVYVTVTGGDLVFTSDGQRIRKR